MTSGSLSLTPSLAQVSPGFPLICAPGMNCSTPGLLACIISGIYNLIVQPKHEFVQGGRSVLDSPLVSPPTHTRAEVIGPANTPESCFILLSFSAPETNALEIIGSHPTSFSTFSSHLEVRGPSKYMKG